MSTQYHIHWADLGQASGDGYGFHGMSVKTLENAKRYGLVEDRGGPIVVRTCSPARFNREPDRVTILYTSWELLEMFQAQIDHARTADLVIVISKFNQDAFRRGMPGVPVEYVPNGVDREHVPVVRSTGRAGQRFRWLWVGAPSIRKGWDVLVGGLEREARGGLWHQMGWADRNGVELYLKWTCRKGEGPVYPEEVVRVGNVIHDTRNLTIPQMAELYRSAHGLVYPARADGFGMVLAEPMASGCPSIFVPWGGCMEYAEGWPVEYDMVESDPTWRWVGGLRTQVPQVRVESLDARMREIMDGYRVAAGRAYEIGKRVYSGFSWDRTGRGFMDLVQRYFNPDGTKKAGTIA